MVCGNRGFSETHFGTQSRDTVNFGPGKFFGGLWAGFRSECARSREYLAQQRSKLWCGHVMSKFGRMHLSHHFISALLDSLNKPTVRQTIKSTCAGSDCRFSRCLRRHTLSRGLPIPYLPSSLGCPRQAYASTARKRPRATARARQFKQDCSRIFLMICEFIISFVYTLTCFI